MKIYVVFGSTGEYSDRIEWMVRAYRTEDAAKECVLEASADARLWQIKMETASVDEFDDITRSHGCLCLSDPPEGYSKADPKMIMSYTGTTYTYEEVELSAY